MIPSLNSIALVTLGIGLIVNHFRINRKVSLEKYVAVIDGAKVPVISYLSKFVFLLAGLALTSSGILWGYGDYKKDIRESNRALVNKTYSIVKKSPKSNESIEAVRFMESTMPLSILSKQNEGELERWYSNQNSLSSLNENAPICIKLYEIYEYVEDREKIRKLERIYNDFFSDYYGKEAYSLKTKFRLQGSDAAERRRQRNNIID
jgi:hypothetical protein